MQTAIRPAGAGRPSGGGASGSATGVSPSRASPPSPRSTTRTGPGALRAGTGTTPQKRRGAPAVAAGCAVPSTTSSQRSGRIHRAGQEQRVGAARLQGGRQRQVERGVQGAGA